MNLEGMIRMIVKATLEEICKMTYKCLCKLRASSINKHVQIRIVGNSRSIVMQALSASSLPMKTQKLIRITLVQSAATTSIKALKICMLIGMLQKKLPIEMIMMDLFLLWLKNSSIHLLQDQLLVIRLKRMAIFKHTQIL